METALHYVTLVIGSTAGLIIVYGVIRGLIELVLVEIGSLKSARDTSVSFERIRYDIGFHLLLGLEFLIAADIVRTIIRPTLDELAILGGIVAIRTVISYFLGKEVEQHSDRQTRER